MPSLSLVQRERIQAAVAGLTGEERHREYMRLRSRALREDPAYRQADNAKKVAHGREAYHTNLEKSRRKCAERKRRARLANPEEARRKSTEGSRRYRARVKARLGRPAREV